MRHKSLHPKRSLEAKKIEDVGKELTARFLASLKKALGADTLEGMHRVSWRHYLVVLFIPIIGALFLSGQSFAAEKTADPVMTKLVSKEGKNVLLEKKAAAEAQKKAVVKKKKTGVTLPAISEEDEKAPGVTKNLEGVISARNNFGVAVVYGNDPKLGELEMWANFTNKMALSGVRKLSDFEAGDTVRLTYKEISSGKKILKGISLVQKKPKEEASAEAELTVPAVKP